MATAHRSLCVAALACLTNACSGAGILQLDTGGSESGQDTATTTVGASGSATEGGDSDAGTGAEPVDSSCWEAETTAPTHFVSVSGDDALGDGTQLAPWATITYAVTQVPDGAVIEVGPGEYLGQVALEGTFAQGILVRAEPRYGARLRHSATVVLVARGIGITLEGFDIAHQAGPAEPYVVHIRDGFGAVGGAEFPTRISLRDNIIHDSYNNDLLRVDSGTEGITIEGNLFFNQGAADEQLDINAATNVAVRCNVFFNDFAASGRTNAQDTTSFLIVKDADGSADGIEGASAVTIDSNIFMGWQGTVATGYVLLSESDTSFYEARDVLVQNNLMLMTGSDRMRAPFGAKSASQVVFRNNTVVGDASASALAFRLNVEGNSPPNDGIEFYNNIWSNPAGTMEDLTDTEFVSPLQNFVLDTNLYFNGGQPIPVDDTDVVNANSDTNPVFADPGLAAALARNPTWDAQTQRFGESARSIREAFEALVAQHGTPTAGSAGVGAGLAAQLPARDITGWARTGPDLGATVAR